jgi:monoamine oxidase
MAQLERLFGPEARQIHSILISDWSTEPCTTTDLDLQGAAHHPQYPAHAPRSFWNNQLLLAGTEVAAEHGGYLEGALEAADALLASLDN